MKIKKNQSEKNARPNNEITIHVEPIVFNDELLRVSVKLKNKNTGVTYAVLDDNGDNVTARIPHCEKPSLEDIARIFYNFTPSRVDDDYLECVNHSANIFLTSQQILIRQVKKHVNYELKLQRRKIRELERRLEDFLTHRGRQYSRQKCNYIYIMRHTNGLFKIGFSSRPEEREKTLQAEDPRLHMIGFFIGTPATEKRLHQIFADLRVRGEWFRLEDRHVDWILTLKPQKAKARKRKSVVN